MIILIKTQISIFNKPYVQTKAGSQSKGIRRIKMKMWMEEIKWSKRESLNVYYQTQCLLKIFLANIFIDATKRLEFLPKIITELIFSLQFFPGLLNRCVCGGGVSQQQHSFTPIVRDVSTVRTQHFSPGRLQLDPSEP